MEHGKPLPYRRSLPRIHLSGTFGKVLILLLFPLLALGMFESFARGSVGGAVHWMVTAPVLFFHNLGFFMGLYWLLALVRSDRIRMSAAVLLLLLFSALGITSYYKTMYRFEPILMTDLWLIGDMTNALQQMELKIDWAWVSLAMGLEMLGLVLTWTLVRGARVKRSILFPLAGAALFGALTLLCSFQNPFMAEHLDLSDSANRGGTVYTLIAMEKQRVSLMNHTFQEEDVKAAWEKINNEAAMDTAQAPNIIFILYESFTDQRHLEEYLHFTRPLLPYYEELLQDCAWGNIYVPKMGGGTSETEFEVLTALVSDYSVNPYSIGIPRLHSVAAILRERGYEATAIHWNPGVFYNRYKNLRLLGFDSFHTTDTNGALFEKTGQFVSDAEHYRSILSRLKKTPGKDFIFCITMQNHGPYGYDDFAVTYGADTPFSDKLSSSTEIVIRNFCYLLAQSDLALRDFMQELSAFEEPTLVVFFSDHIPPFGRPAYEELGMEMGAAEGHLVPYFIWSNREKFSQKADMKAWQLGPYALALAGITGDPFFRYVETLRAQGVNQDDVYQILSEDALFGSQKAYEWAGFVIESDRWRIGGPMELLGFDTREVDGAVYILPRLADSAQRFRLYLNGRPMDDGYMLETDKPFHLQCVMTSPSGEHYNQSEAVRFSSTKDLLERSGRLSDEPIMLCEKRFHLEKEEARFLLIASDEPVKARISCLTMDGNRLTWRVPYGIGHVGQYHVDSKEGPLRLAIDKRLLDGKEPTPENIAAYLEDHDAKAWLFE